MKTMQKLTLVLAILALALPASAQSYRSLLRKANKEYELKAFSQAIRSYQEALERRPDDPEPLGNIADCYRHLNQLELAAENYARAVESRRVERIHILNFAKTLKGLGRYDEARGYFIQYGQEGGDASVGNHYAETCAWAKRQGSPDSDMNVTNERVSTPASDFGPAYYNNDVVFSSARTDIQRSTYNWDGQAKNQLFISNTGSMGSLQPPRLLKGKPSERGEGPATFTSDGSYVAYTRNNFVSGIRHLSTSGMELSIFLAEVGPDGQWYNERPFTHNGNGGRTGYPAFTPDGEAMFFASDRQGGYGGYDIYISYRQGDSWTYPINLGPAVNTPGDEIAPFFDGLNLFFSSDWHIGFGGYDIFRAEQGNGEWTSVSNVGLPVNSPRDDFGYIYNDFQNAGYFASNRVGGRGAEDIYRVTTAGSNVVFRVINASDGRPVSAARIDLSSCRANDYSNNIFTTDARGIFTFPVDANMNCEIIVSGDGYAEKYVTINGMQMMTQGEVDIPLTRQGEQYYGRVLDRSSRMPLSNITVIARNLNSGNTTRSTSEANGSFTLALQPNSRYMITYSGPGYREISKNITTGQNPDQDILGNMLLFSSSAPIDDGGGFDFPDGGNTGGSTIQSGYAVQLAVLSKSPAMSKFSNVESMGDVYVKEEGGRFKVRLGVFSSKSQASNLVSRVRSRGYSGAFVVEEQGAAVAGGGTSNSWQDTSNSGSGVATDSGSGYKIQLVALRNTRWFDPSKISGYGRIEDFPKGDLTIKLLAGFNSLQEARRALPQVRQNGFEGAFIVQEINGQLQKVR